MGEELESADLYRELSAHLFLYAAHLREVRLRRTYVSIARSYEAVARSLVAICESKELLSKVEVGTALHD